MEKQDHIYGWCLIALGIVLLIFKPVDKFNVYLSGKSETIVTVLLIIVIVIHVTIVLKGSAVAKRTALLWAVI